MKRGFSMIELIFVIVILGILASVAVPKLVGTRDDAQAASLLENIGNIQRGLPGYFFATGNPPATARDLTPAISWNGWSLVNSDPSDAGDANGTVAYVFQIQGKDAVAIYVSATDNSVVSIDFLAKDSDGYFNSASTLKSRIESKLGTTISGGDAEMNITVVTQSIF